jgi:DNA-binding transcriptional LysR family regulator
MAANNTQMLLAAALAGAGMVYGPTFVFGEQIARGKLVALLPEYHTSELTIQAVYPSARHMPLKVRHLLDYLVAAFGDEPPWDHVTPQRAVRARRSHGESKPAGS